MPTQEWTPKGEIREIPGSRDYVPNHGLWGFVGLIIWALLYLGIPILILSLVYCGFFFVIRVPACF